MLAARLRDDHSNVLDETTFKVGGTGLWDTFLVSFTVQTRVPSTYLGSVEVFEYSSGGSATELHKQVVRVAFGPALVQPYEYVGFGEHIVGAGETLSGIARLKYNNSALHEMLFAANRDRLAIPTRSRPDRPSAYPNGRPTDGAPPVRHRRSGPAESAAEPRGRARRTTVMDISVQVDCSAAGSDAPRGHPRPDTPRRELRRG
ncbi:hypothetical protein GCM10010472_71610 [Pseudonocardia halophobica]|uniref:Uncharacterized protein n=1 Tax=Pseudonocardia halophobica TaxID=29401 RepID=A0A9W6KZE5_9PSEU|nr:hypothetical protein GCM10017577_21080 [Pseudonocardia halophobica]